jgi:NTP pyrophosphatase (non-canonical NTP hydrolase)
MNIHDRVYPNGKSSPVDYYVFVHKLVKKFDTGNIETNEKLEMLHAAVGVAGEVGELVDAIKKVAIYGKPVDRANVIEELGDLNFYMTAIQEMFLITDLEILDANAKKLGERYSSGEYSDKQAQERADKLVATPGDSNG